MTSCNHEHSLKIPILLGTLSLAPALPNTSPPPSPALLHHAPTSCRTLSLPKVLCSVSEHFTTSLPPFSFLLLKATECTPYTSPNHAPILIVLIRPRPFSFIIMYAQESCNSLMIQGSRIFPTVLHYKRLTKGGRIEKKCLWRCLPSLHCCRLCLVEGVCVARYRGG